jgi:hypothetical protein
VSFCGAIFKRFLGYLAYIVPLCLQ